MLFRTELTLHESERQVSYADKILLLGSCFSENIGNWLRDHYLDVVVNPFGILYNPASISQSLQRLIDEKQYTADDLFLHRGIYHSFDHHSRYSATDVTTALERINQSRHEASLQLKNGNLLLITFGTAWVYTHNEQQQVVSNCHKLPEKIFSRRRLSVEEIVSEWKTLADKLFSLNPDLHIIFTVSPIRHIKDTLHGNQLSKATLLLAIDELTMHSDRIHYFPAYELMMDDLRDYRFYASDMLHPSDVAIEYIRTKFAATYFSEQTKQLFSSCEKFRRALEHRPSDPSSPEYKQFLTQNIEKLNQLIDKNPFFTLRKPLRQFQERI
ncbi:MAG: GSCFA domain-containing protein [Bacteroidales bacterium]